jgi:hypothetical protein
MLEPAILIVGFVASGFHAAGIDSRDIGGSFYNSLWHDACQPGGSGRLQIGLN